MTHSRLTLPFAALAAMLYLAGPASASHEIVMKDGSRIAAGSRPVMALGRVSFRDATGRSRSLPAAAVNLPDTREASRRNGDAPPRTVWTATDLEDAHRSVRLESARSTGTRLNEPSGPSVETRGRSSSTQAQIDVLQDSLDRVRAKRRTLKSYDTEAGTLEERKLVLQSELLRLQTLLELEAEQIASAH